MGLYLLGYPLILPKMWNIPDRNVQKDENVRKDEKLTEG